MKISQSSELLTVGPVSERLGVCDQTVRMWAAEGRLPHIRTANGIRLFRSDDVERLAREREQREGQPSR